MKKKCLVIAHRGERELAPENTIRGCRLALEQGADALEVDVRLSAGGKIVLYHDKTLKRHFGTYRPVGFAQPEEIRKMSYVNASYKYAGEVPGICEFLEEFRGVCPINLDAKTFYTDLPHLANTLINEVSRMNMIDQVWVSSFNPLFLTIVKQFKNSIKTGYLFRNLAPIHRLINIVAKAEAWHPHYSDLTPQLMEAAIKLKKEIYVWTVNHKDIRDTVEKYPIDGIISDTFFRK